MRAVVGRHGATAPPIRGQGAGVEGGGGSSSSCGPLAAITAVEAGRRPVELLLRMVAARIHCLSGRLPLLLMLLLMLWLLLLVVELLESASSSGVAKLILLTSHLKEEGGSH